MYDRGKVMAGILVFLGLTTFPFWFNGGKASVPPKLEIETPAIKQLAEKQCIESTSYMRSSHMKLLDSWRHSVVRKGKRLYVATDGKRYPMSLQKTCLKCHSNKDRFCDKCHRYAGVDPGCWSCHFGPKEKV